MFSLEDRKTAEKTVCLCVLEMKASVLERWEAYSLCRYIGHDTTCIRKVSHKCVAGTDMVCTPFVFRVQFKERLTKRKKENSKQALRSVFKMEWK